MLTRVARNFRLLLVIGVLLTGCDQKALLQKFVPKDDDAFARRFLDVVRAGDYAAADQMLDTSLRGEKSSSGLHELSGVLAHGEPMSVEVIGCNLFTNASSQGSTRTTNLSYQIHFQDSWAAGNVLIGHPSGAASVLGSHFQPIPDSLEVLNRFTFAGKSFVPLPSFRGVGRRNFPIAHRHRRLIGGVTALILTWRNSGPKTWVGPVFVTAWSLFWLYLHNFPYVFRHINGLVSAYRDGQYQVVEGQVQMLHEQPATGHTKGDIITVNGKQFEVNYFYVTPAYRNTLAHGGVLASGVYARIYYHNGEILRVDIRK